MCYWRESCTEWEWFYWEQTYFSLFIKRVSNKMCFWIKLYIILFWKVQILINNHFETKSKFLIFCFQTRLQWARRKPNWWLLIQSCCVRPLVILLYIKISISLQLLARDWLRDRLKRPWHFFRFLVSVLPEQFVLNKLTWICNKHNELIFS